MARIHELGNVFAGRSPLHQLFKTKEYFKSESDVAGDILWFYSRFVTRLIFLIGVVYGFYMQRNTIICDNSQDIPSQFIESLCILPNYGVHGLQDGPFKLPKGQEPAKLNYYIWIYAIFIAQAYLTHLPLLYLCHKQRKLITLLNEINELIHIKGTKKCGKEILVDLKKENGKKDRKKNTKKTKKACLKNVTNEPKEPTSKDRLRKARLDMCLFCVLKLNALFFDKTTKHYIVDLVKAHSLAVGTVILQIGAYVIIFGPKLLYTFFDYVLFFTGLADTLPEDTVFPFAGSCLYHRFGPSGGLSRVDSFCIMKLNLVNLYLVNGMLFLLLVCLFLLIVPLVFQLVYIRTGAFRRQVLIWTHRLKPLFAEYGAKRIHKLYEAEQLATKIYYWPFAMLQFTTIDIEHLLQKADDATGSLKSRTPIRDFDKPGFVWRKKID